MPRVFVVLAVAAALASCGPPETCVASMSCPKGGSVQACSGATSSRYKCSDGTVFDCAGTECSSASRAAANWCSIH